MGEDTTGHYRPPSDNPSKRRVSVDEAARTLGVTIDAIRKRVQRGTIPHQRDESGRVWVLLDPASTTQDASSKVRDVGQDDTGRPGHELLAAKDETIEELRERVRRLEHDLDTRNEEIRRRDHLLAAALERIPALESSRDESGAPETGNEASERETQPERGEAQAAPQRPEERSWWRRFFGFE